MSASKFWIGGCIVCNLTQTQLKYERKELQVWLQSLPPCMTAFWCVASKKREPRAAALSFLIPPKTNRKRGKSISAGNGKINDEGKVRSARVKEGDRILFGKYSGTEIKLDGEDFIIMREEEVLGIITGAPQESELAGSTLSSD